jgi:hypothetical protein
MDSSRRPDHDRCLGSSGPLSILREPSGSRGRHFSRDLVARQHSLTVLDDVGLLESNVRVGLEGRYFVDGVHRPRGPLAVGSSLHRMSKVFLSDPAVSTLTRVGTNRSARLPSGENRNPFGAGAVQFTALSRIQFERVFPLTLIRFSPSARHEKRPFAFNPKVGVKWASLLGLSIPLLLACAERVGGSETTANSGEEGPSLASSAGAAGRSGAPISIGGSTCSSVATPVPPLVTNLPPLSAAGALLKLAVPTFGPPAVAVPLGAREPRPIVIALHAHAVRSEHACSNWQRAAHDWPFVLCPFGLPADARPGQAVTLGNSEYTALEIAAGMKALQARFGEYLAPGPPLLVGWSLGAKVAVRLAQRDAQAFAGLALGEGAYDVLADGAVGATTKASRVLLLCSTRACATSYARIAARFERAGVPCRLAGGTGTKHPFEGDSVESARDAWPWLVQPDARFPKHER